MKLVVMLDSKIAALKVSLILIASVVAVEATAGFIANSLALLGDASHAAFDAVTTMILLLTARLGAKPPDIDHTYGHGKIETLGGMLGGLMLLLLSFILVYESASRLLDGNFVISPGPLGFSAVLYTMTVDLARITVLKRAGSSITVKTDLLHALSDFGSTMIALLGLVLASLGHYGGDSFAGVVLGLLLGYLSLDTVKRTSLELSDATSSDLLSKIRETILKTEGVSECKKLRVRRVGERVYIDSKITVQGDVELDEAHAIASRVETNLAMLIGDVDVTIHVEPGISNLFIERQVKNFTREIESVKEIHNLKILCLKDGIHLAFHARVDPKIDLIKAHDIADHLEKIIYEKIPGVKDVFVHLELYQDGISRAEPLEDPEIIRKIYWIVSQHREIKTLKKSRVYVTEGKLHIYLDCSLDKGKSVDAAHRILSHVEEDLKEIFPNSVVEIHSEPV
ncbi:MAG: cation diffusion facilitator family transporter [Candidatus Bathyarchaeia archaeon]